MWHLEEILREYKSHVKDSGGVGGMQREKEKLPTVMSIVGIQPIMYSSPRP